MSDKDKLKAEKAAHKVTKTELKKLKAEITALEKKLKNDMVSVDEVQGTIEVRTIVGNIHPTISKWFTRSKITQEIQLSRIQEAVRIGLLAQMEARIGHAMNTYKDHVKEELSLIRFYINTFEDDFKTNGIFKTEQEKTVLAALQTYINGHLYQDTISITGTSKTKDGNKTGDLVATIKHQGALNELAIEVKYATDYKRGGVETKSNVKTSFRPEGDTSTSQIIESRMNRKTRYAIIVLDHSLNLQSTTPAIEFLPEAGGFIVKTNLLAGDFSALETAYEIVRQMTIASGPINLDYSILEFLLKDLNTVLKRQKRITNASQDIIKQINKSHKDNIEKVIEISSLFEADLVATRDSMKLTQRVISEFLKTGQLTADDAFETYVKTKANDEWKVEKTRTLDLLNAYKQRMPEQSEGNSSPTTDTSSEETTEANTLDQTNNPSETEKGTAHTEASLNKLKNDELKELCEEKGLAKSGPKAYLIARLLK